VDVGLTGGIACGKSEVGKILKSLGVPVLDTDVVAHELMEPGTPIYRNVVGHFGSKVLTAENRIDRKALGALVFADREARSRLNQVVHPAVGAQWRAWREERRRNGESAVVMIPLLFEVGATDGWSVTVCVAAPESLVIQRLRSRGWNEDEARQRIASQMPLDDKRRRADVVIENDGTLETLRERATAAWQRILAKED
jgi:dephospho-CoA kinase